MMDQTPRKYLMRDLLNKPTPTTVWLQGTIEQTVQNDILIISDSTGKAKITKCETADGIVDKATISKGTYCCIIGTAVKTKGLPEVQASKIVDLSAQPQMRAAWDMEVKDADLYLQGKTCPAGTGNTSEIIYGTNGRWKFFIACGCINYNILEELLEL